MKKALLLIFCLCFMAAGLSAQSSRAHFIIKAGMNISDHAGDDHADAKIGYRVALGADIPVKNIFYIQPTVAFSSKGMKISDTDIKMEQLYVEIPVMFVFKFKINDKIKIPVGVGPYFAVGVAGKVKGDGLNANTFGDFTVDGQEIRRFDVGAGVGVGVEINRFMAGVDMEFGAINLAKEFSNTNMCFTLGVGYMF